MKAQKNAADVLLTPDEDRGFRQALAHLHITEWPVFSNFSEDFHLYSDPHRRLIDCAYSIGLEKFAYALAANTLEIYHDAQEWLVIFYGVLLSLSNKTVDALDGLVEYLIHSPRDMVAFILKVLSQIEVEMTRQIAANFIQTPYTFSEVRSTRAHFMFLYRAALSRLAILKQRLARYDLFF